MNSDQSTVIVWADAPDTNQRWYRHVGCTRWFVPLDDCLPPGTAELRECNDCAAVLKAYPSAAALPQSTIASDEDQHGR